MQKIAFVAAIAMIAAAMPASAGTSLYERNYNVLIGMLPEGSTMEVQVFDNGNLVTQIWTAEQFASFRADFAAQMGRDYTAAAEGAPSGAGDQQYVGDIWIDAWGSTTVNVATPRCLPTTVPIDDKLWLYGGAGSSCGIWENANECFDLFGFFIICSNSYGWTHPQSGSEHGDSWFAGSGLVFIFGAPFGSSAFIDGVEFADNL